MQPTTGRANGTVAHNPSSQLNPFLLWNNAAGARSFRPSSGGPKQQLLGKDRRTTARWPVRKCREQQQTSRCNVCAQDWKRNAKNNADM
eukprot:11158473-Karenia_brevis.AAC.1